jgi:hypothetical protein
VIQTRRFPTLLVILLAIFLIWLLSKIFFVSETKKVDRAIITGKKAIENEDLATAMSVVSEDYNDDFGMDYERLERWFVNHFQRYQGIKIIIPVKRIRVNKDIAVCSLRVSILARNPNTQEYELIYGYSTWGDELILDLVKSNNRWLFSGAHP